MQTNIFTELTKFTTSQENSLTEAFVFVLKVLYERDRESGLKILAILTGLQIDSAIESVSIRTQIAHDSGRPDIEIEIDKVALVHIEVKDDAAFGYKQLEKYHEHLQQRQANYHQVQLVLLSRSKDIISDTTLAASQFHHVRWFEIYDVMSNLYRKTESFDEVSLYLIKSFLEFLECKGMVMKRISWEYIQGVPALYDLGNMIEESIHEVFPESGMKRSCGWRWRGFFILDNCFVGVYYSEPTAIVFANNGDTANATFRKTLDLEQELFFAMTAEMQNQTLREFLSNAQEEMLIAHS